MVSQGNKWQGYRIINPDFLFKVQIMRLKLSYFGHLIRQSSSVNRVPVLGKEEGQGKRG